MLILSDDVSDDSNVDDWKGSSENSVEPRESESDCAEDTV
jgi:hypothetical protein